MKSIDRVEVSAQDICNKARQSIGGTGDIQPNQDGEFGESLKFYGASDTIPLNGQFSVDQELSQLKDEDLILQVEKLLSKKFSNLRRALQGRRDLLNGQEKIEYRYIGKPDKKSLVAKLGEEEPSTIKRNDVVDVEIISRKVIPGREGIDTLQRIKEILLKRLAKKSSVVAQQGQVSEILTNIENAITNRRQELEALRKSSPEAFMAFALVDLKQYHKQAKEGRIIELPSVQNMIKTVRTDLATSGSCCLLGETGLGKTELAIHVGKIIGRENAIKNGENPQSREPLLIRAHARMKTQELYGHQALAAESIDLNDPEVFKRVTDELEQRLVKIASDRHLTEEQTTELRMDMFKQFLTSKTDMVTISKFIEGEAYRAVREGRILIIDEATFLDPSLLASLNRILNLRPGDSLDVQEDGDNPLTKTIVAKEGFGIIFTGNSGKNYQYRLDFDPAFRDRVPVRQYSPLQQATEGIMKDVEPENKELFILLLEELMDKNGNLFVPEKTLEKIWGLACAARHIQTLFSSNETGQLGSNQINIKSMNLSIRGLQNIIAKWKAEGMAYELDYYVFDKINRIDVSAAERAYFYNTLYLSGFFSGEGWPNVANMKIYDNVVNGVFKIDAPKKSAGERRHIPIEQTIEAIYGEIPSRVETDEPVLELLDNELIEKISLLERPTANNELDVAIKTIEEVGCVPTELHTAQLKSKMNSSDVMEVSINGTETKFNPIDMQWIKETSGLDLQNGIIKGFFQEYGISL